MTELQSFALFNRLGGKFRVGIINRCNLNCFFCHNEAMPNPRASSAKPPSDVLETKALVSIINAFTRLGGRQVNITGGEPLAHPELPGFINSIEKRQTKIMLNTNAVLAERLLRLPRLRKLDGILASLHTTDDAIFRGRLAGRSAEQVMRNIVALKAHGYDVHINFSLGGYNKDEFEGVLDFAIEHQIPLKAIAFVGSHQAPTADAGDWVDPIWLKGILAARGAELVERREAFGGMSMAFRVSGCPVKVKNIAEGRLKTDFCDGCAHQRSCGEGIYGLRVGVDGLWKPCLLRRDRFSRVEPKDYERQILSVVHSMIGRWSRRGL